MLKKAQWNLTNLIPDLWDNLRKLFLFIMENILKENIRSSTEKQENKCFYTQKIILLQIYLGDLLNNFNYQ